MFESIAKQFGRRRRLLDVGRASRFVRHVGQRRSDLGMELDRRRIDGRGMTSHGKCEGGARLLFEHPIGAEDVMIDARARTCANLFPVTIQHRRHARPSIRTQFIDRRDTHYDNGMSLAVFDAASARPSAWSALDAVQ